MLHNCERQHWEATLFYFDMINFAALVQEYGDLIEKEILGNFVNYLKATFRKSDILARIDNGRFVAVLKRIDAEYRERLRSYVEKKAKDPVKKLLASFDYLDSWFISKSFYGCPFVSAAGEYGDKQSPVFQEAKLHKRLMLAYYEELARAADLKDPLLVAEQINVLQEGAITVAHVTGDYKAAKKAKVVASKIIEGAMS